MNPEFEDEKPMNPFDFWEGANFKLKIRNVEGYRNYDKSEFDSPEPVMGGNDEKLETLWKKEHSLQEFTDAKQFKSYEALKTRLDKVLGFEGSPIRSKAEDTVAKIDEDIDTRNTGDDEDLDYFKSLAEER